MSIGTLGNANERFRDFLGGGQQDIGAGLQNVLSSYLNPTGDPARLDDRSAGMYQLTQSEYDRIYFDDGRNHFANTWYEEYRSVLQFRAEALKKKLNVAYTRVLERSMYAPVRPNDPWAPQANRDFNDINADNPLELPGAVQGMPTTPPGTQIDETEYIHPDWFDPDTTEPGGPRSSGNPWDDIRRYLNDNWPLPDADGDDNWIKFDEGNAGDPNDGEYTVDGGERGGNPDNIDLWKTNGFFGLGADEFIYNLEDPNIAGGNFTPIYGNTGDAQDWWKGIAQEVNVPPSTSTRFFSLTDPGDGYYISIPDGVNFNYAGLAALLPAAVSGTGPAGSWADGSKPTGSNLRWTRYGWSGSGGFVTTTAAQPPGGPWTEYVILTSGSEFYDPEVMNDSLFVPSPSTYAAPGSGINTSIQINPQLAVPPPPPSLDNAPVNQPDPGLVGSAEADLVNDTALPHYQRDFVDSWLEARALQKREAQVEAAYNAYKDGKAALAGSTSPQSQNLANDYNKLMDQVFSSLDQLGGAASQGMGGPGSTGSFPPMGSPGGGSSVTFPPDMPSSGGDVDITSTMPYGHYLIQTSGGFITSGSVNDAYGHGRDHVVGGGDMGSVYGLIYQRLAFAATDPFAPGTSGSGGIFPQSGTVPPQAIVPAGEFQTVSGDPNAPHRQAVAQAVDSNLYTPIPVGASENEGAGAAGEPGQPNTNSANGVQDLNDTMDQIPTHAQQIDKISKLFVGRQWDYVPGVTGADGSPTAIAGIGAVKYEADTTSAHMMALPGWYAGGEDNPTGPSGPLLTMTPPIEGYALQTAAKYANWGKIDDASNYLLGGSFLRVGGGSDASGFPDWDGDENLYTFGIGFGMGTLGMFWGHTSAVGRIPDVEYLMDDPGFVWDVFTASIDVMQGIGNIGNDGGEMSVFPNVGLFGTSTDFNIPIPIPIPFVGLYWLNIPMTAYGGFSWDIMTDIWQQFLDGLKHEILDSVSVFSYATSGGTAMDSYGMRGEYHFAEKGAFDTLSKMPTFLGGLIDLGSAADTIITSMLSGAETWGGSINNADLEERLLRTRHSYSAGEMRELDTGAFFTTTSFLSQFQMNSLEYSYWTSTQQNEEVANMDMFRMLAVSGKEIMTFFSKALFTSAGRLAGVAPGDAAFIALTVMNTMIQGMQESVNDAIMWDMLLHDQNQKGFVTSQNIMQSGLTSEGYDFIEDERKLFQNDYQANTKKGVITAIFDSLTGTFENPNQVLFGMANTRRYKPFLPGIDGYSGRQGYGQTSGPSPGGSGRGIAAPGQTQGNGRALDGDPAHPLLFDPSRGDSNWDIHRGFWQDSGLGDINEVYVRKNTVTYGNITDGLGYSDITTGTTYATPAVTTEIDRYVGSHNRIYGRAYDGATPIDLQTFRTGYFADKYFGTFINQATSSTFGTGLYNEAVLTGVDGRDATMTLHGGKNYYDRRRDYMIQANIGGQSFQLDAQNALAPSLGGRLKLATIDKNTTLDPDTFLGKDIGGRLNELNKTLYEHMHIKDDGSNMRQVREFRDVFNTEGFLDDIFVSVSANAPTGGGVSSSISLRFRNSSGGYANANSFMNQAELDIYNSQAGGTGTLQVAPSYLGERTLFKNNNRAAVEIFLDNYFAFKRDPKLSPK